MADLVGPWWWKALFGVGVGVLALAGLNSFANWLARTQPYGGQQGVARRVTQQIHNKVGGSLLPAARALRYLSATADAEIAKAALETLRDRITEAVRHVCGNDSEGNRSVIYEFAENGDLDRRFWRGRDLWNGKDDPDPRKRWSQNGSHDREVVNWARTNEDVPPDRVDNVQRRGRRPTRGKPTEAAVFRSLKRSGFVGGSGVPWVPVGFKRLATPARLCCIMQKGGSGKSTTAVCLACELALKGLCVRIWDVDAQLGGTTHWLRPQVDDGAGEPANLLHLFMGEASPDQVTYPTRVPGLYVVPSYTSLKQVERPAAGRRAGHRLGYQQHQRAVRCRDHRLRARARTALGGGARAELSSRSRRRGST
ncbi:AAA family ATPase [Nonomuraea sp. NEAU-L178]|nr:AAA family ATPase [Nonomuraea aurantiaca]